MVVDIVMPLASNKAIPQSVLGAIAKQNIETRLWVHTGMTTGDRLDEARSRNILRDRVSLNGFTVMLDADVEFVTTTDIHEMVEFLEKNETYDAVAIDHKGFGLNLLHVSIGCCCVHNGAFKTVNFEAGEYPMECCCMPANRKLLMTYLDDRKAIEHGN